MSPRAPFLLIAVLTGFLTLNPMPKAWAQQMVNSTDQDVYFAFFKTGGATPDFTRMAKGSQEYRTVPVARQNEFIETEKQRLFREYNKYDATIELLTVRTVAVVELEAKAQEDGSETFQMRISFDDGDVTFFPFQYQDYKIAVIPQQLDQYLTQEIPFHQYELIRKAFGGLTRNKANIFIELKPVRSYMNQPYNIGGVEQWGLVTNVAGITLDARNGTRLWNYNAPWYVSPMTEELRDIYSDTAKRSEDRRKQENPITPGR